MPTDNRKEMLEMTIRVTDQVFFRQLQLILRNVPISERDTADVIQNIFLDMDGKGIKLYRPEEFVPYPLIDDAWGGNARYLKTFLSLDRCKYPERDKYLVLMVKKLYPKLYQHLIR